MSAEEELAWEAERDERRFAEADLAAREVLLESVTVASALAGAITSEIRIESVSQNGDSLRFLIPSDTHAKAAIRAWGVEVPDPREFIASGSRHYSFFVTRAGIRRFVTVVSIPYPEKAGVAS